MDANLGHQRQAQAEAGDADDERGGQLPGAHFGWTDGDDGLDHGAPDGQLGRGERSESETGWVSGIPHRVIAEMIP